MYGSAVRKLLFAYRLRLVRCRAMDVPKKRTRRSQDWFGREGKDGFLHRSWIKNQGYPDDMFDGRPVIGICNTWSELTPCNGHFRELAEFVKRGVYEAGGFPLEFPGDVARRNAAAPHGDVVPQSRQHGRRRIDSRQSASTASCCSWAATRPRPRCSWARRAAICPPSAFPAGRCSRGHFRGKQIGSGTGVWQMSEDVRGGTHVAGRIHRRRILHASLEGSLHDHGHGFDHGQHGRSARRRAARQRGDSRRRCAPLSAGAAHRAAHRRDGRRGNGAVEDPHARRVRECHPRERRDRRIDQCGHSPAGHRRAHRRAAQARGLGQARLGAAVSA